MKPRRVCVLVSGGIDSSVLLADLLRQGCEVDPVYVRCGFRWERAERVWLGRLLRALRCPGLRPLAELEAPMQAVLREHWSVTGRGVPSDSSAWDSVFLPGRNLILLSHAAVFARMRGAGSVALALLRGNPFRDATAKFRHELERVVSTALGGRLRLEAPYRRLDKAQVLARVPGFPVELTFSCIDPRGLRHCGRCAKCAERRAVAA